MTKLDAALALAAKGFAVFPIAPFKKAPPLLNGWPVKATSDPAALAEFWCAVPDANIGLHCNGLVVIDVDIYKDGNESLEFLRLSEDLPATLTTNTPTGGRHLFYRLPDGHSGVPNSVGSLGRGLDVRSTGGYVVAPGSSVELGTYTFEDPDVGIAAAPDWLVLKLGTIVPKVGTTAPVPDAADDTLERAAAWLAGQAPAVEGEGGDARTYAVACGLRDLGVSEAQALALLAPWDERCSPPWGSAALGTKVRNAYSYGQNEPGSRTVVAEDFPIVEVSTPVRPPAAPAGAQRLSAFAEQAHAGAGYVVKGLLQRASYAEVFGAPGEGKTFVALDLAYHVAAGEPWMGRKIHPGPVLYLAYEGTGGMVKRAKALRQRYGSKDVPLWISSATFNLREKGGRAEIGSVISALGEKPVLIVIDTFARALMGGDENSAQDVGAFNNAVAALIESTGACVTIIHHSGKDKSKGARGSSALLGAIDTEIEVDEGRVMARKQRDVELSEPIGFKLVPLVVGVDADGDETTSCVVEEAAAGTVGHERIVGNARRGFDVLCAMRPDNKPVDAQEWRDGCSEFLNGRNVAQRFYDIKKTLLAKGYIDEVDGKVTRRMT